MQRTNSMIRMHDEKMRGTNRVLDGVRGDDLGVIAIGEGRQDVRGDGNGDAPLHESVLLPSSPQARHAHFGFAVLVLQSETALHRCNRRNDEEKTEHRRLDKPTQQTDRQTGG